VIKALLVIKVQQVNLMVYAKNIGLSLKPFEACLNSERYEEKIDQDISDARKAGITGTPGFVLGETTENFVQGTFIGGTRPYIHFQNLINKLLAPK